MNEALLKELYRSLDERWRPEEIAAKVGLLLDTDADGATERALKRTTRHARRSWWSSMSSDFARPPGMGRQLATASTLFGTEERPDYLNLVGIRQFLETINAKIAKSVGRSDFKQDRLNREQRKAADLGELSRRRYNKLFRVSARMEEILEGQCLGKVLRLMAADVAWWHRRTGGQLDPDTKVWAELPLPWDVLSGEVECSRQRVETVCQKHGVDPVKNGWAAPRPGGVIQAFRPTPELVHGVAVSSPELAAVLRKAGWFSGKAARSVDRDVVVYRDPHGFALGAAEASDVEAVVKEREDRQ